jgi:hypoxanthine phosphoribosyltransferase
VTTLHKLPPCRVDAAQYLALIEELVDQAAGLCPPIDSVVGIKRSGLFPAVVLSHRLELPFFTAAEARLFPYPRLQWPLVVDTVAWTGETIRRCQHRLERSGVPAEHLRVLVMYARADPPSPVPHLRWLKTTPSIPQFWYMAAAVGLQAQHATDKDQA